VAGSQAGSQGEGSGEDVTEVLLGKGSSEEVREVPDPAPREQKQHKGGARTGSSSSGT